MKVLLRLVALVVVLLLAAAGWIAWTGNQARDDLTVAHDEATTMLEQARSGDTGGARESLERVQDRTGDASSRTSDPVWRVAAVLPVVGDDLAAVTTLSAEMHTVSTDVLEPLVDVAESVDIASGQVRETDPEAVTLSAERVEAASTALAASRARVEQVTAEGLVGPVADARAQVLEAMDQAQAVLDPLADLADLAP